MVLHTTTAALMLIATWWERLLVSGQVPQRARDLSDAANRDTARYEAMLPEAMGVIAVLAVIFFAVWFIRRRES